MEDGANDAYRAFIASNRKRPGLSETEVWFKAGFERGHATAFAGLEEPAIGEFDREHIGELLANERDYTHFSAHLLRLLVRCDDANLARFALVFPHHVIALQTWRMDPEGYKR